MDSQLQLKLTLSSLKATYNFSSQVGSNLIGGEVIELVSDVGGGKTTLTKGLVKGTGSQDNVTSPSFTIKNEYKSKNFHIAHFDFYRLNDPGIVGDMLNEEIINQQSVVIIEWSNIVESILPKDHVVIKLKNRGLTARSLVIDYPASFDYLFRRIVV